MGQRANYIVVDNSGLTIHYNHVRAYFIPSDLYRNRDEHGRGDEGF